MSTTNCSRFPIINTGNGSTPARLNGSSETSFALQTFRSFASRIRRPLTSILAQFKASASIPSDRLAHPPLPSPRRNEVPLPPANLALVDSEELIREILIRIGEDPDREGLQQTPARMVRSWEEIYGGYEQHAEGILVTQFCAGKYDEMVLLRDVEFYSTCEHHMLPFYGKAHIAYLPNNKIVGLSKLARLLDMHARRLQVQERLTQEVATDLQTILQPRGVAVMIEGKHQCMCCRGVRKKEGTMVTSCLLGAFKENLATRSEFLALAKTDTVGNTPEIAKFPKCRATNMRIILYRKSGCPWSAAVKGFLDELNIPYEIKNVTTNPVYAKEVEALSGQSKSPTLDIDGEILPDASVEDVAKVLEERGIVV